MRDDDDGGRIPFVFLSRRLDCLEKLWYAVARHTRYADGLEMLVKLVQNQAHTVHQAVHIRRLPFRILGPTVGSQRSLELFKIPHPLHRKRVRLHVRLVEH